MIRSHQRKQDEETTYWLSYSDMMAGLLLVFVLIIALTVLHARIQFDMKETELLGKEEELLIQSSALEDEKALVAAQQDKLNEQQIALTEQGEILALQRIQLDEQATALEAQEEELR